MQCPQHWLTVDVAPVPLLRLLLERNALPGLLPSSSCCTYSHHTPMMLSRLVPGSWSPAALQHCLVPSNTMPALAEVGEHRAVMLELEPLAARWPYAAVGHALAHPAASFVQQTRGCSTSRCRHMQCHAPAGRKASLWPDEQSRFSHAPMPAAMPQQHPCAPPLVSSAPPPAALQLGSQHHWKHCAARGEAQSVAA